MGASIYDDVVPALEARTMDPPLCGIVAFAQGGHRVHSSGIHLAEILSGVCTRMMRGA